MNGAQRPSEAASHQVLFNLVERQGVVVADARLAHQLSRLQGLERVQAVGRRTLVVPARSLQHQALPFRCPPESVPAPFVDDQWVSPDAGRRADSDTVIHSTQRAGGSTWGRCGGQCWWDTDRGGGVTKNEGGVSSPTIPFFAVVVLVFRPRPADPNRASGEGRDGSDPPFCAAGAARRMAGCQPRCQAPCQTPSSAFRGGRSRLYVSLQEGSPARTRAGRRAETSGAMFD